MLINLIFQNDVCFQKKINNFLYKKDVLKDEQSIMVITLISLYHLNTFNMCACLFVEIFIKN